MKRTAATIAMLAGLGGCATPDAQQGAKPFGQASVGREVPGVVGPEGGPVHAAGQMPTGKEGVVRADARMPADVAEAVLEAVLASGARPIVMRDA